MKRASGASSVRGDWVIPWRPRRLASAASRRNQDVVVAWERRAYRWIGLVISKVGIANVMPTELLFHVDCLVTCAAPPDCEIPPSFRGPQFNMHLGRGACLKGPRLAFTVFFQLSAPDEAAARVRAADAVKEALAALERDQPRRDMPDELDLHEDRIVVMCLAAREVAAGPSKKTRRGRRHADDQVRSVSQV